MFEFKFKIGTAVFERKMKGISTKVIPYIRVTMEELAKWAKTTVAAHTPPTRAGRTKIRDLWRMRHSRRGTIETYIIENTYGDQNVILWFEEGTKPHVIRAKHRWPLHWTDEDTGQDIYARVVHHPGTPAYRMVAQTEKEVGFKFNFYMKNVFKMVDSVTKK